MIGDIDDTDLKDSMMMLDELNQTANITSGFKDAQSIDDTISPDKRESQFNIQMKSNRSTSGLS